MIGVMFTATPETDDPANALKFYASQRNLTSGHRTVKVGDDIATTARVKVVKIRDRTAIPHGRGLISCTTKGISRLATSSTSSPCLRSWEDLVRSAQGAGRTIRRERDKARIPQTKANSPQSDAKGAQVEGNDGY